MVKGNIGIGRFCLLVTALMVIVNAHAQSTSAWFRIGDASFGGDTQPSAGADYMTVYVRAATVYSKSNWWTHIVERNRQALMTIDFSASIAGVSVSKSVAGKPIDLRNDGSMVDLGYSGIVVDHLPTTFGTATLSVAIDKTSHDGLNDLISMASSLSQVQPPVLSISQQAMGIVNASKSVLDYLLNKQLLTQLMRSQSPIPAGGLLKPGTYVLFAGDKADDYQQYVTAPPGDLKWNGGTLLAKDQPVGRVSYFVIEVGYDKTFFSAPTNCLSFGATKPWVALYLLAAGEVPNINTAADAEKVHDDIQSHLADARTLLNGDPDFIQEEKDAIVSAVHTRIQTAYQARLGALGLLANAAAPAPTPAPAAPIVPPAPQATGPEIDRPRTPPIVLQTTDSLDQEHETLLKQIQKQSAVLRPN